MVWQVEGNKGTVVYVSPQGVGRGSEQLAAKLMAACLDTLAQFAPQISHIVLLNAGVRPALAGSPVLEQIRSLERTGARVLACGTCLNHSGVADPLAVGTVSNVLAILEVLWAANRLISL